MVPAIPALVVFGGGANLRAPAEALKAVAGRAGANWAVRDGLGVAVSKRFRVGLAADLPRVGLERAGDVFAIGTRDDRNRDVAGVEPVGKDAPRWPDTGCALRGV